MHSEFFHSEFFLYTCDLGYQKRLLVAATAAATTATAAEAAGKFFAD